MESGMASLEQDSPSKAVSWVTSQGAITVKNSNQAQKHGLMQPEPAENGGESPPQKIATKRYLQGS